LRPGFFLFRIFENYCATRNFDSDVPIELKDGLAGGGDQVEFVGTAGAVLQHGRGRVRGSLDRLAPTKRRATARKSRIGVESGGSRRWPLNGHGFAL
jgi:hypothetical protein